MILEHAIDEAPCGGWVVSGDVTSCCCEVIERAGRDDQAHYSRLALSLA